MNEKRIKVIYIAGLGRSGSTLLDMIISTSEKVFSVGEIYKFNNLKHSKFQCSCGESFKKCQFWSKFIENKERVNIINRVNVKDYLSAINYLYNPLVKHVAFSNKSDNEALLSKIDSMIKKKGFEYILDSSKDIGRLIELSDCRGIDLYPIIVIRDGRFVADSFTFSQSTQEPGNKNYLVSLGKWILGNTLISRFVEKRRIKHLKISYDLFCENPDRYIKRIEDFLSVRIPHNYAEIIRTMDYHNYDGNRISHKQNRVNFQGVKRRGGLKGQHGDLIKSASSMIAYIFNRRWVYKQ